MAQKKGVLRSELNKRGLFQKSPLPNGSQALVLPKKERVEIVDSFPGFLGVRYHYITRSRDTGLHILRAIPGNRLRPIAN